MKAKKMKTFKLQITEEELIALIAYNTDKLSGMAHPPLEIAQRIVDLTRRLNKDTPEIEVEKEFKPEIPKAWGSS